MDKHYLRDFGRAGVSIVPSHFVAKGQRLRLADCFAGTIVVKPTVSGGGVGLVMLQPAERETFQPEFDLRCAEQGYVVQPLLPEIQTEGEWSLVYFGGDYSHAVHKLPATGQILCHAEQGGSIRFTEPPIRVRALGDEVSSCVKSAFALRYGAKAQRIRFPLAYLRLDVIDTAAGPLVSECEGVEPELFLRSRKGSAAMFADCLERGDEGRANL
jgi:glutathione synthase/RimK-type ligase-like ATP-grasp enzyme